MTTDPVCGMQVEATKAPASATYQGKSYYFCSRGCQQTFSAEPATYVKIAESGSSPKGDRNR